MRNRINFAWMGAQALDIVKQAKVAQILGSSAERRSTRSSARVGSRESLDSVLYDASDEVSLYFTPSVSLVSSPSYSFIPGSFTIGNQAVLTSSKFFSLDHNGIENTKIIFSSSSVVLFSVLPTMILCLLTNYLIQYSNVILLGFLPSFHY